MSSYVFLVECSDFSEAQVLKSFLESQGFHPKVRDEQFRSVAPHLQNLLGKLIIEIPEVEFLLASESLEKLEIAKPKESLTNASQTDSDREQHLLFTQSLAKKAVTNAIIGCIFIPLICNLYSLILSWRVVREERPLTSVSGKRLIIAILFNSLGFYIWLTMGAKYFLQRL